MVWIFLIKLAHRYEESRYPDTIVGMLWPSKDFSMSKANCCTNNFDGLSVDSSSRFLLCVPQIHLNRGLFCSWHISGVSLSPVSFYLSPCVQLKSLVSLWMWEHDNTNLFHSIVGIFMFPWLMYAHCLFFLGYLPFF